LSRENPDALTGGFFAAWAFILYVLAAVFAIMALVGIFGYITGLCRSPPEHVKFQSVVAAASASNN
jgi:hypothetical protein